MLQKTEGAVQGFWDWPGCWGWLLPPRWPDLVRTTVLLAQPIPGGDELKKAAKGLLRSIYEDVPFLSPLPTPMLLRRNPGGTLKMKPTCVFAHLLRLLHSTNLFWACAFFQGLSLISNTPRSSTTGILAQHFARDLCVFRNCNKLQRRWQPCPHSYPHVCSIFFPTHCSMLWFMSPGPCCKRS